jgi:hypothetical protein
MRTTAARSGKAISVGLGLMVRNAGRNHFRRTDVGVRPTGCYPEALA